MLAKKKVLMITKCFLFLIVSFVSIRSLSQEVIRIVMVGEAGVTEDPEKATSFIVIKQYPNSSYERLDYKKGGPLVKLRSFKGPELKVLEGRYCEYGINGRLSVSGNYLNNAKDGRWNTFNDSGELVTSRRYLSDSIVEII